MHIPTSDTIDELFYAPLANLDASGARVYLGATHNMATLKERLDVARKFVPDFGLAAYCGFARTPPRNCPTFCAIILRLSRSPGCDIGPYDVA